MKISKTAVLTVGSALMIAGLGLLFVSASDSFPSKTLVVDPNNAVQQFVRVRIVPTESGDNSMADIVKKGNLFGIETDYNFTLSRSGDNANEISGGTMGSSILGGIINKILGGKYNGILGGKNNEISTGNNNGILGGENNKIDAGNYSVIFGGKGNKSNGSYLSIVGGSGNTANSGNYLVVAGRNNVARGYNSVVMGSGSKLDATASFLWTDGSRADALKNDHVFAVLGDSGMVINATEAHELAQLTISGSLVIYDDKNAPECTQETKGVVKVVNGNGSVGSNKCFCSCNGSGRNPLHEGARCTSCNDKIEEITQVCGRVERVCSSDPYLYTGNTTSGACVYGELVNGTGAFFVSTKREGNVLTNYINRSCQLSSGGVIELCQQKLEGNGCANHFTGECLWREGVDTGNIMMSNNRTPKDTATYWTYDVTGFNEDKLCTYKCDEYSERDGKRCVQYECTGVLGDGAELYDKTLLPKNDNTPYFYSETSSGACSYYCTGDYYYDATEDKCVTCPEGEVYVNGKCTTVCDMSKTNYGNITLMDNDGYAITIADRNVGATASDISKPESLGCYFQWGNSYGFQPLGNIKTGDRVDASGYGPSTYSSDRYVVMSEFHVAPYYGDWSLTPNNNLWGGSGDNFANAFGLKVTQAQKKDRKGPCPEGYHVPSIGEWSDLFTIWYKNKHGSADWAYVKDGGKIVASKNREDVVGFTNEIKLAPLGERDNWGNAVFIPQNKGGSYWASSSPWIANSLMVGSNVMEPEDNNANSFDFSIDNTWGGHDPTSYLGHGNRGVKGSGQGVRCFKDEPICPEGKRWNQTDLKCEEYVDTEVVDLEVFMVSSTGNISHYVMMDRNLGATEVYNQDYNSPNRASYGYYYQYGNNYGFSGAELGRIHVLVYDFDTPPAHENASEYGPDNYYSAPVYHIYSDWDTSNNENLWGDVTNTLQARQGPCPDEYHVPTNADWENLYGHRKDAEVLIENSTGVQLASDFLMPFAGGIRASAYNQNQSYKVDSYNWDDYGYYWSSTNSHQAVAHAHGFYFDHTRKRGNGFYYANTISVRCFKNSINYQKLTVHPDGGTGAVISIDWETSSRGKIVALGEPTKAGYTFGGWYTNSSFTNRVSKGSTISEGSHLYAKWVNDTPETIKITCNLSDPAVVEWCDNSAIPSAKLGNIKYQISVGNKDIPIDVYTKIDYIAWYNGNYEVIDNNSGRLKHVTNVSGYQNNRDGFSPSSTTCNTNGHSNVYITKYASLSPDSEVTEKTITNDGKTYNISLECNVPQLGTIVNECTVTYDLGDGKGKGGKLVGRSSNTETVNCGEKVTLPNATWDRHEFWGWLKNGVRVGGFGNDYMVGEDVTLKAYWSQEMHICKNSTNNPLFQEGITAQVNGAGDEDGEMTLYPDEQAAQGKSCAYVCTGDYVYLYPDGDKQARCAKCAQGSERKNERGELIGCAETIDACPPGYRYDPTASENPCFLPGSCLKYGSESNKKPDNAIGNFEDMQSDSAQYYDWKCRFKEQDVELHRCQFSCEKGYVCNSSSDGYGDSCVLPTCYRHTYMNGDKNAIQASSEKPSEFHEYWKFMTGVSNVEEFNAKISKLNGNYGCYYWCDDDHLYTGGGYYQCFEGGQPPAEEPKTCKGSRSYLWGNDGTNSTPTPGHDTRQTFWSLTGYEHASEGCTEYCREGTEGLYLEKEVSIQPGSDDYEVCWKQCSNKVKQFYKGIYGCAFCGYGQRANPDESTWLPYNDSRGNPVDCVNICRDDETYSNDSDVCNGKSECCKLTNVSGRSCDELEGGPYIEVPLPGGGYDCIRDPEEVGG